MKFVADEDNLTIKFEGLERFFAFKRQLVLPRKDIENLQWTEEFFDKDRALRVVGTGVPGALLAGRFRDIDSGERLFLYITRPKGIKILTGFGGRNVLVITMLDGRYSQIIVNCRADIGAKLSVWWRSND